MLAGFIVEKLGNDTWEIQLEKKILKPLGMTSTRVMRYPVDIASPGVAQPYFFHNDINDFENVSQESFK